MKKNSLRLQKRVLIEGVALLRSSPASKKHIPCWLEDLSEGGALVWVDSNLFQSSETLELVWIPFEGAPSYAMPSKILRKKKLGKSFSYSLRFQKTPSLITQYFIKSCVQAHRA